MQAFQNMYKRSCFNLLLENQISRIKLNYLNNLQRLINKMQSKHLSNMRLRQKFLINSQQLSLSNNSQNHQKLHNINSLLQWHLNNLIHQKTAFNNLQQSNPISQMQSKNQQWKFSNNLQHQKIHNINNLQWRHHSSHS